MRKLTSNLPQGQYRSESARALAEKVARQDAAASLNVTIDFHLDTTKRDLTMLRAVIASLSAGHEFILYQDQKNYTIFMPKFRTASCFMNGVEYSRDVSKSWEDFGKRVKMGLMGYEHFFQPPIKLDDATTVLQLQ